MHNFQRLAVSQRVRDIGVGHLDMQPPSADELSEWVGARLAGYKRPRRYVFIASLPRSQVGKLLRRKLAAGEYEPERPRQPRSEKGSPP